MFKRKTDGCPGYTSVIIRRPVSQSRAGEAFGRTMTSCHCGDISRHKQTKKKYKLAVLTSHPIQYQAPLFRRLAQHLKIDLTVYFCCKYGVTEKLDPGFGKVFKWDIPLLEGYKYKFLSNFGQRDNLDAFFSLINWEIIKELKEIDYDFLLVYGYGYFTNWLSFYGAWRKNIPILLRGDSHLLDRQSFGKILLKQVILRILFKVVKGALYVGTSNRTYYQKYGMKDGQLFFVPYCVDNDFFANQAKLLKNQVQRLRCQFKIENDYPIILFCGKLISKKNPLTILRAFSLVRRNRLCNLLFAGDGELRRDIERIIEEEKVPNVYFTGFLNQSKISEAYAVSDMLVLPSIQQETWGFVINEGMNFGLPIITTDKVGASFDLVKNRINGYIVPPENEKVLAKSIDELLASSQKKKVYGRNSLNIIKDWSIDSCVDGIVKCLENIGLRNE